MTLAERTIRTQKDNLKEVHNTRFAVNGWEIKLAYVGGIGEFIDILGRQNTEKPFKSIGGFFAYNMNKANEVVDHAFHMVASIFEK